MKRLIGLAIAVAITTQVNAQNLKEAEKNFNYGKYETVKKDLQPSIDKNADAAYLYGLSELQLENTAAAKAIFAKHPSDFKNQAGTARILFLEKKASDAQKILFDIVDGAKKKDWEKYKIAADAMSQSEGGNIQEALKWYEKAMEINPKDGSINLAMGDAYLNKIQNGGGSAMTQYEKGLEKGSVKSLAHYKMGSLRYRARNYTLAQEQYAKAQELDPSNPLPFRDLARAYMYANNNKLALENAEKFIKLSDNTLKDRVVYLNILIKSKKFAEAEKTINEMLAANAKEPTLYRALGYAQYEGGKYNEALKSMNTFLEQNTDKSKISKDDYLYLAKINTGLAEKDSVNADSYLAKADDNYVKALNLSSDDAERLETMSEIAELYKENKNYLEAGKWFGKIIALNSNATNKIYFDWGLYTFYGRDYEGALNAFTKLKEKYPADAGTATYWQGRSAAAIDSDGKTGQAEPYFVEWLNYEKEGYEKKDNDKLTAYQYLAYYYANNSKEKDALVYVNKILEIQPDHKYANSLKDYFAKKGIR